MSNRAGNWTAYASSVSGAPRLDPRGDVILERAHYEAVCAGAREKSIFLSHDELVELTGCKRASDQVGWLRRSGIPFYIRGVDKRPVVCRATFEKQASPGAARAPQLRLTGAKRPAP